MNWSLILTFLAMGIAVLMIAGDFAAINVSLSAMNSGADGHWIINAYILAFSMFLVTAGRFSDLLGRKKVFLTGLFFFAVMSLLGAIAKSNDGLIAARFFQGMGAAMMWPSIVGICYTSVPLEKRSFIIGLLLGAVGIGTAIGLLVGDFLTQQMGWRAILWANIPFSLLAAVVAFFQLESRKREGKTKLDYLGMVTLSLAVLTFMYGVQNSHLFGFFSLQLWGIIALALLLIVLFFVLQAKVSHSLIPSYMLKNQSFVASTLIFALISPAFFATLLYLPQFMQKFLGFSIYEAGLGLTPILLIWAFVSPVAGDLSHYVGAKMMTFIATSAIAVGTFLLGFVGAESDYYFLLPGMIITGLGYGFGFSSITTSAVRSVDDEDASTAAGVAYLFFVLGGAIGLALAYGIFYIFGENQLGTFINQSYIRGYFFTMFIMALLAAFGAFLALLCLKKNESKA